MRGVIKQGILLGGSLALTAAVVTLGSASAQTQRAAGPACNPAAELCLLDAAPWVSPQVIRYQGPVGVTALDVRLKQSSDTSRADDVEPIAQDATTKTWQAVLPPKLKERNLEIRATSEGVVLENETTGQVRRVIDDAKVKIGKDGGRRIANFGFDARKPLRVTVQLALTAKYPAEKSERVKQWKERKTITDLGNGRVRVKTDNVESRCKSYSACKLTASAQVKAVGYKVANESDRDNVPTPPERFSGSLGFVPGNAFSGGGGRRYNYAVYVERGIKIDRKLFAKDVGEVLGDSRSWKRSGRVSFRQVDNASSANTRIILASPNLVDRLCAPLNTAGYVSCTQGSSVVLNLNRWRFAVPHFDNRLEYRRMLVNHEIGHRIGQGHRNCSGSGNKAPVMQQQTYGLQGCKSNPWPLSGELGTVRRVSARGWLD